MTSATLTINGPGARTGHRGGSEIDSRPAYTGFGLGYLLGHGAAALSHGTDPLVRLPGWLPLALLGSGLAVGTVASVVASARAQRNAPAAEATTGKLLGAAWVTAFLALFLAITGLSMTHGLPDLQSLLWPTGSGLVVGLLYLAEGAARRNTLHYALGSWLALISTGALFLDAAGPFWVLALAGGGAYLVATGLETRRLAGA